MKVFLALFLVVFYSAIYSQTKHIPLDWGDKITHQNTIDSKSISEIDPLHFDYDENENSLFYSYTFDFSERFNLTNVKTKPTNIKGLINDIPQQLTYNFAKATSRGDLNSILILNPFVVKDGIIHRVVSFDVFSSPKSSQAFTEKNSISNSTGLSNSIFSLGKIKKFYVEETGVHRIEFSFLKRLGINEVSIPSSNIKIYGHGGGMLPLVNSENEYFDPPELAIQIFDGGDGTFDEGDYALFYATNTAQWSEENATHLNLYADRSYYYLSIDSGAGKRMSVIRQPTGVATTTISEFDDYQFYEIDETSLSLVGRRWFGDRFDIETERTYEFEFPNLVKNKPVLLDIRVGAISSAPSSFNVSVNEQLMGTSLNMRAATSLSPSRGSVLKEQIASSSDQIKVTLNFNKNGNPGARGFLDFISIKAKRGLIAGENQFKFKNEEASTLSGIGEYVIQNAANVNQIWDITDPYNPSFTTNEDNTTVFSIKSQLGSENEYQAVTSTYFQPKIESGAIQVPQQNIKGNILSNAQGQFQDVDYLIITQSSFMSAANRLAQYRREKDGLVVKTLAVEQIYEEFNSGKQDIGAIRNLIKYIYDNASSSQNRIKYLGIIGDASVDYKNRLQGNTNIVPTYHSLGSFATTDSSFMSDDFYTMMDPKEGDMSISNSMDLAVGRILADTPQRADAMVSKIITSEQNEAYGQWRNNFVLISDDADKLSDFRLQVDLDKLGDRISSEKPTVNVKKIHSDAFQQVSGGGRNRYPEVNKAITEAVELGAAAVNYFGHGGEDGLAQERIVTQTNVQDWTNPARYTCFVTITCEFTKFDNPLRTTGGELTFWNQSGGASSLVTTTRAISVIDGVVFNNEFSPFLFDFEEQNTTIAESVMKAKQQISRKGKRIVFFIGDPAMKLPLPKPQIKLTRINDTPFSEFKDTLQALGKYKFKGEIVNAANAKLSNYNGELSATVFDKRIKRRTLGNDNTRKTSGELAIMDFTTLGENLFRGQASVTNGEFEFEFVLPKDTRLPVDKGRISFYSSNQEKTEEYSGSNNEVFIGGLNEDAPQDNEGPLINLFMNDENFVNGGVTNSQPFILALLEDENGINTAGGIGHDIIAILDNDEANPIILNEYYEADQDNYTKGKVYFQLRDLEEGEHTLRLKAWDVYNNSKTQDISFVVAGDEELKITQVLNYPNPFINYTEFWFNHNRPFEPLEVMVQVFTVSGKLVWSQNQIAHTNGFLFRGMSWDGRDDFGDKIGKGVYVYKLSVKSTLTNHKVETYEKLVIL